MTFLNGSFPDPEPKPPDPRGRAAVEDICEALTSLQADLYVLLVKTRNFQFHVTGPHFHDYHRMLGEQAAQIAEAIPNLAHRTRRVGGATLRSIGEIGRLQRLKDNDVAPLTPAAMLVELRDDNVRLEGWLRETHDVSEVHADLATAALIERLLDEAEARAWTLAEIAG